MHQRTHQRFALAVCPDAPHAGALHRCDLPFAAARRGRADGAVQRLVEGIARLRRIHLQTQLEQRLFHPVHLPVEGGGKGRQGRQQRFVRAMELRITQQRLAVARTNLVLQTETYNILKSRLDSGIGDELAVRQSKYIVDQTHATIPKLLAQEERQMNAIAILV